jgi:hypothetical protein
MSPDLQELEANLRGLRPAVPGRALLARLDQAADGSLVNLNPAIAPFENSLRRIQPARLPASLMAAVQAALTAPAATTGAAIVPFPQVAPAPAAQLRHGRRPMLAAAAAVALLGAAAALFIPGKSSPRSAAAPAAPSPQTPIFAAAPTSPATRNFVPAAFNTGLSQASDEGVLWQSKNQPTRVVKVVYWDRVTLVNPEGKKIEYEKPRVEYILVPEEID